jgi:hypothetical protein
MNALKFNGEPDDGISGNSDQVYVTVVSFLCWRLNFHITIKLHLIIVII